MTTITIELPINLYKRLQTEAAQRGQPPEEIAQAWVTERLTPHHPDAPPPAPPGERERAIAMMRDAGLLAELRAYPNNPSGRNLMALQSHEFYPISVKRIGS